jgi:hypothetical protein
MKTIFKQCLIAAALVGALALATTVARADEGGAGHYAPGSFASFIDVLPDKPGLGVFNYFTYYNGDANASRPIPIAGQIAANVSATAYAETIGAFWVTPLKIFGGNYAPGVAVPFVWNEVSATVQIGNRSVSRSGYASGLGDIEFWPVAISWSAISNDLHIDFFGGIYAPSGSYDKNQLANQGFNYWTFEPGLMVSYLGNKNGFEASTYIGYDINTENNATGYQSGDVFHIDATVAQHLPLGKGFVGVGASGFYLQQTTGDSGGRLGSFKEETAGVGPTLSYAAQFTKWAFAAQVTWLPQISTENTLSGNYIWFKLGVQF